jgi:glycine oxidase
MSNRTVQVLVVGAGASGSAIAAQMRASGYDTVLVRGAVQHSASAAAAGMIAPVMEPLTDAVAAPHAAFLAEAVRLWPDFAKRFGVELRRNSALWLSDQATEAAARLHPDDFQLVDLEFARRTAPLLGPWTGPIGWAPGESSLTAALALSALHHSFEQSGGQVVEGLARFTSAGVQVGEQVFRADHLVLAPGYDGVRLAQIAPELAQLQPIRGQILKVFHPAIAAHMPVIRGQGAYLAPQTQGVAMVGASMEAGLDELTNTDEVILRLMTAASAYAPQLATARIEPMVGIRAGTPDGLSLVGPSSRSGVLLAAGLRRNGWLLAPLVAQLINAYIAGDDPGPFAGLLDPRRQG